MNPQAQPFLIAVLFGVVAWGLVLLRYVWPWMQARPLREAVEPLLYVHCFRYIGMAFVAPGVVGANLNPAWAHDAAWGDVGAAVLALTALAFRKTKTFPYLLVLFNAWGLFDLLRAAVFRPAYNVPQNLGAAFYIPTLGVPMLVWTHIAMLAVLFRTYRRAHTRAIDPQGQH